MIYTVGHSKSYRQCAEDHGEVFKLGRNTEYMGGICFETYNDAQQYIKEFNHPNWEVFGLLAEWGVDTDPDDQYWHSLLVNKEIIIDVGKEKTN